MRILFILLISLLSVLNATSQQLVGTTEVLQEITCAGGSNGSVVVHASGGSLFPPGSNYLIQWYKVVFPNDEFLNQSDSIATGLTAGQYYAEVKDCSDCPGVISDTVTLNDAPPISVEVIPTAVSCFGGSNGIATANVYSSDTPFQFLWTNGDTTFIADSLIAGEYDVTITSGSGCLQVNHVTVTEPETPVTVSGTVQQQSGYTACDGAITLNASGGTVYEGYYYLWSNDSSSQNLSGLCAGIYTVTVTDGNGCKAADSFEITEPNPPLSIIIELQQPITCNGGNNGSLVAHVTGGNVYPPGAGYYYDWYKVGTPADSVLDQTDSIATGLSAGDYYVSIKVCSDCPWVASDIFTLNDAEGTAVEFTKTPVSCFGGNNGTATANIYSSDGPYQFLWSNGDTTATADTLTAGTYDVTITSASGCVQNFSTEVYEPVSPLSIDGTVQQQSAYAACDGAITLNVSGGTNFIGYSYLWSNDSTAQNLSGLCAGIYSVTVTDDAGCTKDTSFTITEVNPPLSVSIAVLQSITCNGSNNGSIVAHAANGIPFSSGLPYFYEWYQVVGSSSVLLPGNDSVITGLSAGDYYVSVKDNNDGPPLISDTITLNNPPGINYENFGTDISCYGAHDGTATVNIYGDNGPFHTQWATGDTTSLISGLSAGTYLFTLTYNNGCTKTDSVTINEPDSIIVSTTHLNVLCNGGNTGSVDLSVSGGTPGYTFNWGAGQPSTEDLNGLIAGTYTVTVTDNRGCSKSTSVIVTEAPAIVLSATQVNISCNTGNTGSIDLTASGGTPGYTYNWGAGQPATQDRTGLTAGTYNVTVTDANGCTQSASYTITEASAITLSSTQTNVSCNAGTNGSIDLTVSGGTPGYTYNWGAGQPATQDRTGLTAGTYNVTVTDANGCTQTAGITISEPAAIALSATQTNVTCNAGSNGTINLSVSGGTPGYTFNWGAGQPTTEDRNGLIAGTYNVTVTDAAGCTQSTSVTITQPAAIILTTTQTNVSCNAGTNGTIDLTVSGGTPGYTYNWGAGQPTTQDRTGLNAGNYAVTVTDANGCTKSTSITITQPAAIVLTTTQTNVSCNAGTNGTIDVTVSGGTPGYTYDWGVGQPTTEDRTGLVAGNYNVIVTDANGCTKSTTVSITQPTAITLTTTQVNVLCNGGTSGSIDLTVSGGTPGYTYNWGAGQPTIQDRSGLIAGVYTVTVTDAVGCIKSTSVTITEPGAIALTTTQVNLLCNGATNGSIDLTVTGGTPGYTYNWGAGQPTTQDRTGLAAGAYNVIVTDINGCTKSTSVNITEPAAIALSASLTNVSCNAGSNGSIDLTVSGGTPGYTYNWGAGQPTTQDRSGLIAGTYNVTVTDANGCTKSTSAIITQPAAITLTTSQVNVLCNGSATGSIDLTVSGGTPGYTYNWGAGQPTTQDRTGLISGTYNVIVTDANGCTKSTSITISQPTAITLSTTQVNVICNGAPTGSIDLTVSGGIPGYSYNWGAGQPAIQDRTGLTAGTYNVIVTDANGCTKSTSIIITQPTAITLTVAQTNISCSGGNNGAIDLTVTGGTPGYTYNWGAGQPTTQDRTGLTAGNYNVTVTDASGCIQSANIIITQPNPLSLGISGVNVSCFGGNNGTATATVTGGSTPYQYQWTNGGTTASISNLTAGNYFVLVKDANLCERQGFVTITSPSAISITGVVTQPKCFQACNGSIILNVTGGTGLFTYQWSNGALTKDVSGLCAGNYTVTVKDANNCTRSASFTLVNPAPVTINLGPNRTLCSGQSFSADATINITGTSYQWTATNGFASPFPAVTLNLAGTYYVQATTPIGCIAKDTIIITTTNGQISSEFIVSTQAFKGRTVTLVNISSPAPDSIQWLIPANPNITVQNKTNAICELIFSDTGTYNISMKAFAGQCEKILTKKVIVLEPQPFTNIGPVRDPLIKNFVVSPVPNNGQFTARVELNEVSKVRLRMINILTNVQVSDRSFAGSDLYVIPYNIVVSPGVYLLLLETPVSNRVYKVVIN